MKVSLPFVCTCGKHIVIHAIAGRDLPNFTCPSCGAFFHGAGRVMVSDGVLSRSREEIDAGDYALAIVFAAMAAECELAALFFKWKYIDSLNETNAEPPTEALETELRGYDILKKLDAIATLLVSKGFDQFVMEQQELAKWIKDFGGSELSEGSIKSNIRARLFWPRNRILHFGHTNFDSANADACLRVAVVVIHVLRTMDQQRVPPS
jgi:hypothetical protein